MKHPQQHCPEIPEGWWALPVGTIIEANDRFHDMSTWHYTHREGCPIKKDSYPYIRKGLAPGQTAPVAQKMTLPTDSAARKEVPVFRGALRYFPAAIAGVAGISKKGNDKHNPNEEMHHARGKSSDHGDCILRHLIDVEDLRKAGASPDEILHEVNQMAWRALAFSQELHEQIGGCPMAPGAK